MDRANGFRFLGVLAPGLWAIGVCGPDDTPQDMLFSVASSRSKNIPDYSVYFPEARGIIPVVELTSRSLAWHLFCRFHFLPLDRPSTFLAGTTATFNCDPESKARGYAHLS